MIRTVWLGLVALIGLGMLGCATTPRSSFYALSQGEPVRLNAPAGLALAIGPIDLPRYLDRPQIVSRSGGNRLDVDDFNRWGGALDEEISRVLTGHLARSLQTDRVFSYPSRLAADSDYRIALDVRSFDGVRGGAVSLSLTWSLTDDRSGEVLRTEQASYRANAADAGVEAYVVAMSQALADLADDLSRAVAQTAASHR